MSMRPLLASFCLALLPGFALAQEAAPTQDRPEIKLSEVERGLFFGAEGGGLLLFGPAAGTGSTASGLSSGRSLGVTVGFDLGEMFSLAALVMGTTVDTPAGFIGAGGLKGDFSGLTVGALAKVSFFGSADANGVKRLWIYARAGGGLSMMGPKDFYLGNDILLMGGAGLEYFTHLRHFSVGLTADFVFGLSNLGAGVMISPNLRYTF